MRYSKIGNMRPTESVGSLITKMAAGKKGSIVVYPAELTSAKMVNLLELYVIGGIVIEVKGDDATIKAHVTNPNKMGLDMVAVQVKSGHWVMWSPDTWMSTFRNYLMRVHVSAMQYITQGKNHNYLALKFS